MANDKTLGKIMVDLQNAKDYLLELQNRDDYGAWQLIREQQTEVNQLELKVRSLQDQLKVERGEYD